MFGMSGGSSSSRTSSTSTSTTPWTNIAGQLASSLKSNLSDLASGKSIKDTISALTASTTRGIRTGIGNIKEAFGASGMRFSTDLMKSLSDYQVGQQTGLNTQIAQVSQMGIQDQLAALSQIIQLGAGSGTTTGSGTSKTSNFGWNLATALIG